MKRSILSVVFLFLCGIGIYALPSGAYAVPIKLTDFYLEGDGSVASDGSSATLEIQDPVYGYTLLVNDPLWNDPGISVGADALSISFDFEFFEPVGNDTEFYVRLFDGQNGDFLDDLLVDETSTGTHTFDLTSLLNGQTLLGMEFEITEYNYGSDGLFNTGSWVTIKDLDLAVQGQVPVPEPGTLMLLGTGLIALGGGIRKKSRQ